MQCTLTSDIQPCKPLHTSVDPPVFASVLSVFPADDVDACAGSVSAVLGSTGGVGSFGSAVPGNSALRSVFLL